jgi:hypothetical protein
VTLYGDKEWQGKQGWWNLHYAASDGSQKLVVIDMKGDGHVGDYSGPIDWKKHEGRRTDLTDVQRRLEDLLARKSIEAKFMADADRLLVTYSVREFQIYPQEDDGSYSDKLETIIGPQSDGFWLEARVVNKVDGRYYGFDRGVYWRWHRGTFFLADPEKYLAMDFRGGPRLDAIDLSLTTEIMQIFGKPTPSDFDPSP